MGFEGRRKEKYEAAGEFVKKNEEDPGRGKGSTKESARGNEEVCRQETRERRGI